MRYLQEVEIERCAEAFRTVLDNVAMRCTEEYKWHTLLQRTGAKNRKMGDA